MNAHLRRRKSITLRSAHNTLVRMTQQADHVVAIDQGTTSTRVIVFNRQAQPVASAQREHRQLFERPGWVGHDAVEIWQTTRDLLGEALSRARLGAHRIAGVGITNQRETTVVWNAITGEPIADAIVWQDTRTQSIIDQLAAEVDDSGQPFGRERLRRITGLPLASYFSAGKIKWLLDEVPGARELAERGELRFGTIDTWLIYQLTGGAAGGGLHVTDVTNASRTQLCDIHSLEWSDEALAVFDVPRSMMPNIVSSSEVIGTVHGVAGLEGVPIAGVLGDQQAATFGQAALKPGDAKQTFGTGGFLIVNTGEKPVFSQNGLLTTVAYKIANQPAIYALEGSVAVAGSLHHWLRDNLGIIRDSLEIEGLASSVPDTGGVFIVPAFSGLFAPRWQPDARGVIVGLTRFINRAHIVRAASEAAVYQTVEVIHAAAADTETTLTQLRVDGGGSASDMMMQFQSDMLGIDVVRPENLETTALGAAFAAGMATGLWSGTDELSGLVRESRRWVPSMPIEQRERLLRLWNRAVERSLDWVDDDVRAAGGA